MKIILNLSGWKKEVDAPDYIVDKGCIEVDIYPPIGILVKDRDSYIPQEDGGIKVLFVYNGQTENGVLVFQNSG